MNLIFIFCLSGFCFSSCQKAAEKQVYIDYCYQLNQSLLHCAQGDKEAATENLGKPKNYSTSKQVFRSRIG
ncbi:MAG: hypothetical protein H6554_00175 [Chitinophagales bacterium]|nr:hypothetical protein [Chitinophagales bacterium]